VLDRTQIAKRVAEEERLGNEYEARGDIGEAQVHWNLAAQWRAQLNAPGREPGAGDAPPDPRGARLFADEQAKAPAPIVLPEQLVIADAPKKAAAAAAAMLAPTLAPPDGPAPSWRARAVGAIGSSARWLGFALLGAGIGTVAVRIATGGRR